MGMTIDEAIEHGKEQLEIFGGEHRAFIELAIKALVQDTTTKNDLGVELIDRVELLKAMDTWDKFGYTETGCFVREPKGDYVPYVHYEDMVNCVKGMTPVTPQEPRWIPVSERLPEIHQDVILSLRSLDIEIGFRAETEPYFYCHGADGCYIELQNVIAWMPLPKAYREVEK